MLKFYTSQYNYKGKNRLDITIKGNDPVGIFFAPSWDLLMDYKRNAISQEEYILRYYDLMRIRYKNSKSAFLDLLNQSEAVMVCFEKPEEGFCHRYILGYILQKLGATYGGELKVNGEFWGMIDLNKFQDPRKF